MPTYCYECEWCATQTIAVHGMSESPEVTCSKCSGKTFRVIGAAAARASNRSIDAIVGEDAEKRYQRIYERADSEARQSGETESTRRAKHVAKHQGDV